MVRVSPRQAELFKRNLKRAREPPAAATTTRMPQRRPREQLPENILEQQIRDFLAYRGWNCHRQHVLTVRAPSGNVIRIGRRGLCDWRAERAVTGQVGLVEQFEFEVKAPNEKLRSQQAEYIRRRRLLGFMAEWFNEYDRGANSFTDWYRETWG